MVHQSGHNLYLHYNSLCPLHCHMCMTMANRDSSTSAGATLGYLLTSAGSYNISLSYHLLNLAIASSMEDTIWTCDHELIFNLLHSLYGY